MTGTRPIQVREMTHVISIAANLLQLTLLKSDTLKSDKSSKVTGFAAADALPPIACGPDIGQVLEATGLPEFGGCPILRLESYHNAFLVKIKINTGGREGVGRFTGLPLWTGLVGREAICLLFFPLLLQSAVVFPGIVVGTQGFVDCVYCVGAACCIVFFLALVMSISFVTRSRH
jgi:hypothetical protein